MELPIKLSLAKVHCKLNWSKVCKAESTCITFHLLTLRKTDAKAEKKDKTKRKSSTGNTHARISLLLASLTHALVDRMSAVDRQSNNKMRHSSSLHRDSTLQVGFEKFEQDSMQLDTAVTQAVNHQANVCVCVCLVCVHAHEIFFLLPPFKHVMS